MLILLAVNLDSQIMVNKKYMHVKGGTNLILTTQGQLRPHLVVEQGTLQLATYSARVKNRDWLIVL